MAMRDQVLRTFEPLTVRHASALRQVPSRVHPRRTDIKRRVKAVAQQILWEQPEHLTEAIDIVLGRNA